MNKLMSLYKTTTIAFISTLICACSPKQKQDTVDIEQLIPENAQVAFSTKANQKLLKETLESQYSKDILALLKSNNSKLKEIYLEKTNDLANDIKDNLNLFIDANDIAGSIEKIAKSNISISAYVTKFDEKNPEFLLAVKIPDIEFRNKVLNILQTSQDFVKTEQNDVKIFTTPKSTEGQSITIANKFDAFLISMDKEIIDSTIAQIESSKSKSLLDNADFKKLISKTTESELWFYASENFFDFYSTIIDNNEFPQLTKGFAIQSNMDSITNSETTVKLELKEDKSFIDLMSTYKDLSNSEVKGTVKDPQMFLSLPLPDISAEVSKEITSLSPEFNPMIVTMAISVFNNINKIEISSNMGDMKNPLDLLKSKLIANFDVTNANTILPLLAQFAKKTTIANIECYQTGELTIAKISDKKISVIVGLDVENSIKLVLEDKSDKKIQSNLSKLKLDKPITEIFVDLAQFSKFASVVNKDLKDIQSLNDIYTENKLTAKLAVEGNTIILKAKSDVAYDTKKAKEIISNLLENL